MTLQINLYTNLNQRFFRDLPADPLQHACHYLDPKDLLAAACVCRNWRDNLTEQSQIARSILLQYPQELAEIFQRYYKSIDQLPVLDLGERQGETGYIDFLRPKDLSAPVMRFKDRRGRPGIAFKIQTDKEIVFQRQVQLLEPARRDLFSLITRVTECFSSPHHASVLTLFMRNEEDPSTWVHAWDPLVKNIFEERHLAKGHEGTRFTACPKCPFLFAKMNSSVVLPPLLKGEDRDFSLLKTNSNLFKKILLATALIAVGILTYSYL